jgi:hypothetical protein
MAILNPSSDKFCDPLMVVLDILGGRAMQIDVKLRRERYKPINNLIGFI